MAMNRLVRRGLAMWAMLLLCAHGLGCCSVCHPDPKLCSCPIPRELVKVSLPEYVVEPPDILLIDAIRVIPKPPYHISPLDVLVITANVPPTREPIQGQYMVDTDGTVNLGPTFGSVQVAGMTLEEAKKAIEDFLIKQNIKDPQVSVVLAQSSALQQIRGEHLVTPDGTVHLGVYGHVHVTGMTLAEVRQAVEAHLSQYLVNPEVSVDVLGYNSKVIYVILDGAGNGQLIYRLPVTGNDTVLDVIAQVSGLTALSSQKHIWVARPGPACAKCAQVFPVDWCGVTQEARTETNFQLFPGDRVFVGGDPLITTDVYLAKLFAPLERVFGLVLLGNGTVRSVGAPFPTRGAGGAAAVGAAAGAAAATGGVGGGF